MNDLESVSAAFPTMGLEMGEILFTCPQTLKSVPTGLKAEWVVLHSLPPVAIPILCAACGQTHEWKRKDAWIGQLAEFRTDKGARCDAGGRSREEEGVKGEPRPSPRSVPDPPITPPAIAAVERAVYPTAA
jgi:hypothetical protein